MLQGILQFDGHLCDFVFQQSHFKSQPVALTLHLFAGFRAEFVQHALEVFRKQRVAQFVQFVRRLRHIHDIADSLHPFLQCLHLLTGQS